MNCEYAYFLLKKCWFKSLDYDKDWIPCEKICKK